MVSRSICWDSGRSKKHHCNCLTFYRYKTKILIFVILLYTTNWSFTTKGVKCILSKTLIICSFYQAEESAASSLTSNVAEKGDTRVARVLFNWTKEDPNEDQLSIVKGNKVIVTSVTDSNWWYGKLPDDSAHGWVRELPRIGNKIACLLHWLI